MNARKPVEAGCTGGVMCPVDGHVETLQRKSGRWVTRHKPLTRGQRTTLLERWRAERELRQS